MYSELQLTLKFLRYYFASSNGMGHGIHSPFIFEFITEILNDKNHYPEYGKVEKLRSRLLKDKTILQVDDFGAGSSINNLNKRKVADIAKKSAKSKKMAQLLFRIVKKYKPAIILDLGTSLGITTSYLSLANPDGKIFSFEGAGEVASIAGKNFTEFGLSNIKLIVGNFDDSLLPTITQLPVIDLAFIDGNHRREPTERYFQYLLSKSNNDSILIFDDIHWSREMEEAWKSIQCNSSVRCTIDLFFVGIVFFRQEFKEKQHFSIRF